MNQPKLVSFKQLSLILGKSESSLRYHMRMGRITPCSGLGRCKVFDVEEVLREIKRGSKSK